MEEFEPKKKVKIFTKDFLAKNVYVLVLAVLLLGGITYGYTFFIHNEKIASGSITTANLTINFTDRSISASNLSKPTDNQEGLSEYSKSVTITNQTAIDGRVKLTLTRTSGLALTDMSYALIVNGAIQTIDDVPANGEIFSSAIMGGSPTGEIINFEVRLWPKTTYTGSETTFVGELTPEIKYLGPVAADKSNINGKYVNFNCNGSTCEEWRIVKVEDERLVLTRETDYFGATSRTNSNRYNPTESFNDDSLITSLSTDKKYVFLAKTVKINGGSGTFADPYILINNDFREPDKKVVAVITYKDGSTTLGTQNVYYNETNYIGRDAQAGWSDGTNRYVLGDTVSFTTDTNLSLLQVQAVNLSFDNTTTGFNCTDAQCAIEKLSWLIDPPTPATETIGAIQSLETTPYGKIYTGADPDNYVWFNNEQWRILGVYNDAVTGQENLKIIKATPSTTSQKWQNSYNDGNAWAGSLVQSTYLYGNYTTIINDATSRAMIEENARWNVGDSSYADTAGDMYHWLGQLTWTGKIGLITGYEYLYAAINTCWNTAGDYYNDSGCKYDDWLYSTITSYSDYDAWTINPSSDYPDDEGAVMVGADGYAGMGRVDDNYAVSPVVFLKSTVIITGGNGQAGETNSYKLALS